MYRINTIPGEAAKAKGHASYPEDFPHLSPGEDFAAWRTGEHWEIETTLNGAALEERMRTFTKQEERLTGEEETHEQRGV